MKTKFWLVLLLAAFILGSLANSGNSGSALLRMESEFMKAAADHGSQGYMSYYADDAVEVPNGATFLQGKVEIAKTMAFLDNPDNHLTWVAVGSAASGDLGYTYGTYEFRSKDKDGKPVVDHGKYTTIWKKQRDGSWKVALDMGNSGW